MRKVVTFLSASLLLAWAVPLFAQPQAPDAFKDVPTDHWAYQAVENLRQKGIVIGYPDGYFRGKRTLTRYEFAVALDRALAKIQLTPGPQGEAGPAGPAGPQGEVGPPGVTPEELENFRKLAQEFRDELASLGNTVAGINRKLDALAKQVAELAEKVNRMPVITGRAWTGIRSDRASGNYPLYVDRDGAVVTPQSMNVASLVSGGVPGIGTLLGAALPNFRNTPAVLHELELGVLANIPGGATLDAGLVTGTYQNYLGPDRAIAIPLRFQDPANDTYLNRLEINTPLAGIGSGSKLTFGRFGHQVSHLTLWKPDVDTYFDNPIEQNGLITMDGFRLTTNLGSVSADLFGGKTGSVTGTNALPIIGNLPGGTLSVGMNSPLAGALVPASFANNGAGSGINVPGKPIAQTNQGQMLVDAMAGVSMGLNIRQLEGGHVRLSAIDTVAKSGYALPILVPDGEGGSTLAASPITNVLVLGADADLKIADHFVVNAEYGKSIIGHSRVEGIPGGPPFTNTSDNNAFSATLGYTGGGLNVSAGYRYIDPLFYAPGYWGRIGNWVNPTNVQGPIVRASYDLTPAIGINVGGDFFTAAKNRGSVGGLTSDDDINRVLVGLKWNATKSLFATADWEGVFYHFGVPSGAATGILGNGTSVHPTEHYVTLGAGYNLTSNTVLKVAYQFGSFNGHDALTSAGMNRYNFNVFTSQVAVKF